jgi:DNA-binding transcriptional ArsR family regulator
MDDDGRDALDDIERLLWWLAQGSAGAPTRVRVLRAIKDRPRNAQQLAEELGMDYTTIRHHLRILASNHLIQTAGDRYGQVYFLSPGLESHWPVFERITAPRGTDRGRQ